MVYGRHHSRWALPRAWPPTGYSAGASLAVTEREQFGIAGVISATGAITWIVAPSTPPPCTAGCPCHPSSSLSINHAVVFVRVVILRRLDIVPKHATRLSAPPHSALGAI